MCLDVDAKGFLELCVVLTGTFKGNAWVIFSWIWKSFCFSEFRWIGCPRFSRDQHHTIFTFQIMIHGVSGDLRFILSSVGPLRGVVLNCTVDENFRIDRRAYRSKPKWTKKHFCPLRCSIVIEHQPRTQVACLPRDLNRFFSLTTTPLEGPNSL